MKTDNLTVQGVINFYDKIDKEELWIGSYSSYIYLEDILYTIKWIPTLKNKSFKFYKDNVDLIRNECYKLKNKSVLDELYNEN